MNLCLRWSLLAWVVVLCGACSAAWQTRPAPTPVRRESSAVQFALKRLSAESEKVERYEATYRSGAELARFQIQWEVTGPFATDGGMAMAFGKGALIAIPGSKSDAMVAQLCRVLEAKPCPAPPPHRVERVEFTLAILGRNLGRVKADSKQIIGGEFAGSGTWIAMKLFLGTDEDEAEVYLNLNPHEGAGEFAIKDSDYGADVMKKLVTVL